MAHGAGAGMAHPFMAAIANDLAARGIATLRYQFPYMERGSKRPDTPEGRACRRPRRRRRGRAAVARTCALRRRQVLRRTDDVAGASGIGVAGGARPRVPRIPAASAGEARRRARRASFDVQIPMLFLQGTRDEFAELQLLEALVDQARQARDAAPVRRCRPFVSCPGTHGTQGSGRQGGTGRCDRGVDRKPCPLH